MSPFLRNRSRLAREEAVRHLEVTVERLGSLVLNLTALADRIEDRAATDAEQAQQRQERIDLLRRTAHAGQDALAQLTAHLTGHRLTDTARPAGQSVSGL